MQLRPAGEFDRVLAALLRRRFPVPDAELLPPGAMVELAGRGKTFVVDIPGPAAEAPTVVLLHALGTTAYLSWYPSFAKLAARYRVVALDLRWHGRGIRSPRFTLADCADDVAALLDVAGVEQAILAGYSMGGAVAQLAWRRHPGRVSGLVLCSTARNFRGSASERAFFASVAAATYPLSRYALGRVERLAATLPELPSVDTADITAWGRAEFRSTSAWVVPEVLRELGRFNSAPWLGEVDVPSAVVVTARDRAIAPRRQHRLAAAIPGAAVCVAPGGHGALVLDAARWGPVFLDALQLVAGADAARPVR
jgi:pimeloyl-ACP methyl ester carboxylesterase